jgi:preprotein translocase subunit YajC
MDDFETTVIVVNTLLCLVVLLIFGLVIRLIVGTIQSYRQQKKYLPNMKVGDSVWFSTPETDINGVVEEIDGDFVKVSLTIRKDRLHQNNLVN